MKRLAVLVSVSLVIAGLLSFIQFSVAEEVKWAKKADVPTARAMFPTCAVNGLIYAMGGWTNAGGFFRTVEAYDPNADTWAKKANMPSARDCFSAVAVNGVIYTFGGGNGNAMSVVEAYDPVKDTWEQKNNMPTPRWALSASDANDIIYVIGGGAGLAGGLAPLSTVEAYNPETDKWEKKADMPTPRDALSASVVNGKIYAIGGHGVIVEEYDTGFIPPRSLDPEGKLAVTWGGIKRGG